MKKGLIILFSIIIAQFSFAKNLPLSKVVSYFEKQVKVRIGKKIRIAADNITYAKSKMGTALSVFLESKIAGQLDDSTKFSSLSRADLDRILSELEMAQSDLFNKRKSVKLGKLHGVQGLISGEYIVTNHYIMLNLRLLSLKTSKIIARAQSRIPKVKIPTGLDLYPVNFAVMKKNSFPLPQKGKLKIEVWTSRGKGGVYEEGEKLQVYFRANRSCYLRLYHVDVNGKKQLIFPNQFHPDNKKLNANEIYYFPSNDMNFDFELGAPFGVEMIQAVASTDTFTNKVAAFQEIKGQNGNIFARGLTVIKRATELSNDRVYYTIKKRM